MTKVGITHCFDMDRLGHAGVKVKWEPVEAWHGVNAQADARRTAILGLVVEFHWPSVSSTQVSGSSPDGLTDAGDQHRPLQ
ncbi:hypothetical protein FA071_04390 [Pseudomonas aeruginosa]|nr:hypothetical protein [Pseudomonas aeruginosa]